MIRKLRTTLWMEICAAQRKYIPGVPLFFSKLNNHNKLWWSVRTIKSTGQIKYVFYHNSPNPAFLLKRRKNKRSKDSYSQQIYLGNVIIPSSSFCDRGIHAEFRTPMTTSSGFFPCCPTKFQGYIFFKSTNFIPRRLQGGYDFSSLDFF